MAERMIEADGVELCTEAFGDAGDPPVLLVMGMSASMVWWETAFCERLSDEGRFVIRYDHRDTGRSVTYPPGHPRYTGSDLVADAVRVLDAYGCGAADVVGVSMGGALTQLLALDFPDRVRSLVLISTSPALPGERRLTPSDGRFQRFIGAAQVDWSDTTSVVEYVIDYWRALWGRERAFDEARIRELARSDARRARDVAAAQNHGLLEDGGRRRPALSAIAAPTLVIHGTDDPMFPLDHGAALAEEIPGARLLPLSGAGHGVDPDDWDTIIGAILEHSRPALHR